MSAVRRVHELFEAANSPYAIIGGVAVARNGAIRTTQDIDLLTEREGWERVRASAPTSFETTTEGATDTETGIHIDVLFAGDDWEMVFPMPHPREGSEYDEALGAWFIDCQHLIELKCAVYLAKRRADGIELAAKDLADVVELMRANRHGMTPAALSSMHPGVRGEVRRIWRRVSRAKGGR